jgi:hypothetical protein
MAKATVDVRKQVWKFQEAAVVLALLAAGTKRSSISWHEGKPPVGMSIEPDVVIQTNGSPVVVLFVTHASCEHGADKKFWRGVAEVVEAKRLPSHPRLINILFSSETKKNLSLLNEKLYDGCLHLDQKSYGRELTDSIQRLAEEHGSGNKDDCFDILLRAVEEKRLPGFAAFRKDLASSLSSSFGQYHKRLSSSAFSSPRRDLFSQRTAFRRGLTKLFTLPKETRTLLYARKNIKRAPEHALALGWFVNTVAGSRLEDEDLAWLIRFVGADVADRIMKQAEKELPAFSQYSRTLNEAGVLRLASEWIGGNYSSLSTAVGMEKALDDVFKAPKRALEPLGLGNREVGHHWLLASIISMLRTETGRADGYGYSKLGLEAGRTRELNAFAGTIIAPYLQLRARLESGLRSDIAKVLAGHLKRLGKEQSKYLLEKSVGTTLESIFNYQLSGYRHFNPIQWELVRALSAEKVDYEWPVTHNSFLSEETGEISSSTGNLIGVAAGRAFIKCQSAYDGRIDKRKELCGRVGAMKLAYLEKELKRVKFYLVLDGYFDQEDIDLLSKAGWDGVYYPHELNALLKDLRASLDL